MTFIVAAAQYPVERLADGAHYAAKLERWHAEAADRGARLAVFPEYGAMELASLDPQTMGDLARSMAFVAGLMPQVDQLHRELAARHGMHVLAASGPFRREDGTYVNRARLFAPNGKMGVQDKLIMTRFEREEWGIASGRRINIFQTDLGRIAVLICYDCEFPLLAREAVEVGADIILVPSCTDSLHGYWRVRLGAQCRALESQCFTIQAPTVGEAQWSPAVDINRGSAGVYGPPDVGLPDDGVISLGTEGKPGWVFADIDLSLAQYLRENGTVLNVLHWPEQLRSDHGREIVDLASP